MFEGHQFAMIDSPAIREASFTCLAQSKRHLFAGTTASTIMVFSKKDVCEREDMHMCKMPKSVKRYCTQVFIHIYIYICTCIYIFTYTYFHKHLYKFIGIYISICLCTIYIFIYTGNFEATETYHFMRKYLYRELFNLFHKWYVRMYIHRYACVCRYVYACVCT
jgi:hypothetical protein